MPNFVDEAHVRAVEHFIEFARQRRETEVSGEEAREVEAELDNILYLLTWCSQGEKWHYVADLVGAVEELLFILGLFDERVAYSRDAALACERMGDLSRKAHFLILVGGTLPLQGKYGDAEKALNEALQSARSAHDDSEVSRALRTLSLNAYRQSRYEQANELLKGTDELAIRAGDMHNYVDILYLHGCIEFMQGDYDRAEATLELMLETSQEIQWERAKAYALRELGEIAELRHDYAEALESFEKGLTIALSYGDRRQIARLQMSLANLSMYMGNLSKAEKLALEAQDTFGRLGMWNELAEVEAILSRLRKRPKWFWSLITRVSKPRVRYTNKPIGGD
jgi:tetratricopeptide (TPR) repeat protein